MHARGRKELLRRQNQEGSLARSLSRAVRAIISIAIVGACFGAIGRFNLVPAARQLVEVAAFSLLTVGTCVTIFILTEPFRRPRA
jgi:hypothetical protein